MRPPFFRLRAAAARPARTLLGCAVWIMHGARERPRILVAEDDEAMRGLVVEALRKGGYEVFEVTDGGRLLVMLAREHVLNGGESPLDLLVSDVRMPVCTGLEIAEQLRAIRSGLPIVLMTAFGDAETTRRARALDAVVLEKPFGMQALRETVARLLGR